MKSAQGITGFVYVSGMGDNPASVNRETGKMYLNYELFQRIKPEHRLFIMLHEMGHVVLQSTDEKEVDRWAFREYAKRGYSLKEAVFALTKLLSGESREQYDRIYNQLVRAKDYDYNFYGNKEIFIKNKLSNFKGNNSKKQRAMTRLQQIKINNIKKREATKARIRRDRGETIKNNINEFEINKNAIDEEVKAMKERAAAWWREHPFQAVPKEILWPHLVENIAPVIPRPMKK